MIKKDKEKENVNEESVGDKTEVPAFVSVPVEEYEALKGQEQEVIDAKDECLRKIADFENAKKRLVKEKEDFAKFANEHLISGFLPILDNMERALAHTDNTNIDAVIAGVTMIKKQIEDALSSHGLEKIEAKGKLFDPHEHEAVGTIPSCEHEADTVVEEVQSGYKLKDKLLRPSWVRVAVAAGTVEEETGGDE